MLEIHTKNPTHFEVYSLNHTRDPTINLRQITYLTDFGRSGISANSSAQQARSQSGASVGRVPKTQIRRASGRRLQGLVVF